MDPAHLDALPARLTALNLSARTFARLIADLSGRPVQYRTVERWMAGTCPVSDAALALVAMLERAHVVM